MSIFILLGVLLGGALLGCSLRKVLILVRVNQHLTKISLWALLLVMGAKLAQQRSLFVNDLKIFFVAIGSSVALTLAFFLIFWLMGAIRKRFSKDIAISPPINLVDSTENNKRGFHELFSVAINGACILSGFLLFWLVPNTYTEIFSIDFFTDWLLKALLFFIGFDLGVEIHRLELRQLSPTLLFVPFWNIAMSLAIGMVFGMLSGLGMRQGTLLTAGMGWYSLSSVLLADRGLMLISILAFIHNVFRELFSILFTPLAVRVSPMLPVYLGGATSMDVMLPFIQRYCGREYTLVSFYSGIVCSTAVLPLVKLLAG